MVVLQQFFLEKKKVLKVKAITHLQKHFYITVLGCFMYTKHIGHICSAL